VRNILAPKNLPVLRAFAQEKVLLAFDFDGTLSPIVRDPDAATMRPRTRRLMEQLAERYPCVVISGRARPDVQGKVDGLRLRAVIGNHGMETTRPTAAVLRRTAAWHAQLAAALPGIPGLVIEDKGSSLAVHYRRAKSPTTVRRKVRAAVELLRGVRIVDGKMVVNVMPTDAAHKGTALLGLCKRLRCPAAIYLGDDDNDEDAFKLDRSKLRLLGIRVGASHRSHADYYVISQASVDTLLAELLVARA
jgi:trehalose 6-phosphate phosphatase